MNTIGPGLMNGTMKASITADLTSLITDPDTSTSVTVTTPASSSFNAASGIYTPSSTPETVSGHLAPLTAREVDASALYQEGDHKLLLTVASLATEPRTDSTVTIGAVVWRVVQVEKDGLGAAYRFVIRLSS